MFIYSRLEEILFLEICSKMLKWKKKFKFLLWTLSYDISVSQMLSWSLQYVLLKSGVVYLQACVFFLNWYLLHVCAIFGSRPLALNCFLYYFCCKIYSTHCWHCYAVSNCICDISATLPNTCLLYSIAISFYATKVSLEVSQDLVS